MYDKMILSDELLSQIGVSDKLKSDADSREVKFDSNGTMRIVGYDEDGSKVDDIHLNPLKPQPRDDENQEMIDQIRTLRKSNRKTSILFYLVIGILILLTGFTIFTLRMLTKM